MNLARSLLIVKALADPSRLRIVNALAGKDHYVEELAERVKLAVSTVSFHLKKLEKAGLVHKRKEQYYVVYTLNQEVLKMRLADLLTVSDDEQQRQQVRLQQYRAKILRTFFRKGKLLQLPVQKKKRRIVLEEIAKDFQAKQIYDQQEINAIIAKRYPDYCTIRREFIEGQIMSRENQQYRLTAEEAKPAPQIQKPPMIQQAAPTPTQREALKRAYQQNPPRAGIFKITNQTNGKILIGKGLNVAGILNSQQSQLKWGTHKNQLLQEDWNKYGAQQFNVEVLDTLEADDDFQLLRQDLAALEELWLNKLQPYGENGYHL